MSGWEVHRYEMRRAAPEPHVWRDVDSESTDFMTLSFLPGNIGRGSSKKSSGGADRKKRKRDKEKKKKKKKAKKKKKKKKKKPKKKKSSGKQKDKKRDETGDTDTDSESDSSSSGSTDSESEERDDVYASTSAGRLQSSDSKRRRKYVPKTSRSVGSEDQNPGTDLGASPEADTRKGNGAKTKDFFRCETFRGFRPRMVFKLGSKGLGYYRDGSASDGQKQEGHENQHHSNASDDSGDDEDVGPQLPPALAKKSGVADLGSTKSSEGAYGAALLPGEGAAIAQYVKQNIRVPRRGEVGWTGTEIDKFEKLGYVMSGSRHKRMNAVRLRKENQVYTAEEKRQLALLQYQQQQERNELVAQEFQQMVDEELSKK